MTVPGRTRIKVHVQPRAARTEIVGMHGDAIKIRLAGPPIGNAANQELVKYLASKLSLNRQQICIVGGSTSRRKAEAVGGLGAASVFAKLGVQVREA